MLLPKDGIGIISPAGPIKEKELEKGIDILKEQGFFIKIGSNTFASHDYLAGSDRDRVSDLHSMFMDNEIKAIICSRGGYGSLRILNRIDYKIIEKNSKIFVGYSDITALLLAINKKTGLITFHGPVIRDFSRISSADIEWLINLLKGKVREVFVEESQIIISGKSKGILMGGNLSVICHLIGTPFMPSLRDAILFLEDKDEPYYRIDRMFTHLKLSGHLDQISALILGSFEGCGRMDIINQIVFDIVSDIGFPVISGFPIGHGRRNAAIPIGIKVELETENKIVRFLERPVI